MHEYTHLRQLVWHRITQNIPEESEFGQVAIAGATLEGFLQSVQNLRAH